MILPIGSSLSGQIHKVRKQNHAHQGLRGVERETLGCTEKRLAGLFHNINITPLKYTLTKGQGSQLCNVGLPK